MLRGPASRAAVFVEFGGGQLVPVRQDMALDGDGAVIGHVMGGRGRPWLGGVPGHERVPRRDGLAIQEQFEFWARALDQTMEDHGQMGFDVVDQIVEVVCGLSVGDDAVHRLPQNERLPFKAVK